MRQKIILFLLLVFVAWNNVAFSHENNNSWNGYWGSDCETERNVFNEIPFSYEYVDNLLIIYKRIRFLERKVPYNYCSIDDEGLMKYIETFLEIH